LVLEHPFEARILRPSKGDDNHQNTLQLKINNMNKYRNPNSLKNKKFSMTYDNRTHLDVNNNTENLNELAERFLPNLNTKNENTSPNYSQAYQKHHANKSQDHRNIYRPSTFTRKSSLNSRYQHNNDGHNISDNCVISTKLIKNIPPR
jgi:hypothetical protein